MDVLLPSEEVMEKMAKEYARALADTGGKVLSLDAADGAASPRRGGDRACPGFLLLYFAFALGYNSGYGNALADADGNLGRLQSRQGRDGDFDYFFPRK